MAIKIEHYAEDKTAVHTIYFDPLFQESLDSKDKYSLTRPITEVFDPSIKEFAEYKFSAPKASTSEDSAALSIYALEFIGEKWQTNKTCQEVIKELREDLSRKSEDYIKKLMKKHDAELAKMESAEDEKVNSKSKRSHLDANERPSGSASNFNTQSKGSRTSGREGNY